MVREDWAIFRHPRMDDSRAKDLLGEILNDGDIVRQKFVPASDSTIDRLSEWESFCDELRYHNRYFPASAIDLVRLEALLWPLKLDADEIPTQWFRARIQTGDAALSPGEMGAHLQIELHRMGGPTQQVFRISISVRARWWRYLRYARTPGNGFA